MNSKKDLEKVLEDEVKPVIEKAIQKHLGVSIEKLREDITDKIKKNPLSEIDVDLTLSFKSAKKAFRKEYLERVLRASTGDISKAAKKAGTDRRTIHRMISELGIDISACRKNKLKEEYLKKEALNLAIGDALKHYKDILHPKKMVELYRDVPDMSEKILHKYPFTFPKLKEAEQDFEKRFIKKALEKSKGNISLAARMIDLRYETLHRKMKELDIKS